MEQIKELTKRLIANSFKELMLQIPFEKITIKMITDHASVIRPTFYNHFHDKYELVEWIVRDEIIVPAKEMFRDGMVSEGIRHIFQGFYKDREYYQKAFGITGQNGFGETLIKNLAEVFAEVLDSHAVAGGEAAGRELISKYYSGGLITIIRYLVFDMKDMTPEELMEVYRYMMEHSIYQITE